MYFATVFVFKATLVVHVGAMADEIAENKENQEWYQRDHIMLDDTMLATIPKLKDALVRAPDMPRYGNGELQRYSVGLSGLEIDQINKMLAGTEKVQGLRLSIIIQCVLMHSCSDKFFQFVFFTIHLH